jgi:hypothetical protein
MPVVLTEESQYSRYLSARLNVVGRALTTGNEGVAWRQGDVITTEYGLSYLKKTASLRR